MPFLGADRVSSLPAFAYRRDLLTPKFRQDWGQAHTPLEVLTKSIRHPRKGSLSVPTHKHSMC